MERKPPDLEPSTRLDTFRLALADAPRNLLLDVAQMGTFVWHIEENRGEIDAPMLALFGLPPDATLNLAAALAELIHRDDRTRCAAAMARATDPEAAGALFEDFRILCPDGGERWLSVRGKTEFVDAPRRAVRMHGVATDITDHRRIEADFRAREERQTFLLKLSDALRFIADPLEIQTVALRLLGEHLAVNRAFYVEVDEAQDAFVVRRTFANGVSPFIGHFRLSELPRTAEVAGSGQIVVWDDVTVDPRLSQAERSFYASIETAAGIGVPLTKGGHWVVGLGVHNATPRHWSPEEIALVSETAERTWAAVERARAEEALARSSEKYHTLFDSIDEGFALIDLTYDADGDMADMVFREVNRAYERQSGLGNVVGRSVIEVEPQWTDVVTQVARTGNPLRMEHHRPDVGCWWDGYFSLVRGNNQIIAVVLNDITARKRHEANLGFLADISQDLAHLTSIGETMNHLGAKLGGHFKATRCAFFEFNEALDGAVCEFDWHQADEPSLVGTYRTSDFYNEEFLQTMRAGKAFIVNDRDTDSRASAQNLAALNIASCIVIPIARDGHLRFALSVNHAAPRQWPDDEVGLMLEITNRIWMRLERARAEQDRERFARLADNSPDFVGIFTPEGMSTYINSAGLDMVGLDGLERARQIPISEFFFPEDGAMIRDEFLPQVLRDGSKQIEVRLRNFKTGAPIWMTYAVVALKDTADRLTTLAIVGRDITERRRMEEALREADRRKDEFLATLAHELRNPLAPIRNALHVLRAAPDGLPLERVHRILDRQVNHMVRLLDDLLEVSRISRGVIELQLVPLHLAQTVHDAIDASRPEIERAKLRLDVVLPTEPICVVGDALRLSQIISNLLNNAARYSNPGGHIQLNVRCDGGHALVEVSDSGIGIAPDQLTGVFAMFGQINRGDARSQGGLGIGLALAQNLAQMHGGVVEAHSEGLGHGSRFTLRLPLAPTAALVRDVPQERHEQPILAMRVLVVDDNHDVADSTVILLSGLGAEARALYDGRSALAAIEEWQPSVVLLDIGMPDMDGCEVARRVRSDARHDGRTLVALTGWGQKEDRQRTRDAGFNHHFVKPIDPIGLQTLLETLNSRA